MTVIQRPPIKILVQDKFYTTSQATLTKYPNSKLAAYFSDTGLTQVSRLEDNSIFIDRNP